MDLWAIDKQKHMFGSALIALSIGVVFLYYDGSLTTAFILANIPGIIKEILDDKKPGNRFDIKDIFANIIGSGAAIICLKLLDFFIFSQAWI